MKVFNDHRGLFVITQGGKYTQTFVSTSSKSYTFRGLHYQTNPYQKKTVKIIQGAVIDFLYDINTHESKSFFLTPESDILEISENYAHGFLTLVPNSIVMYGVEGEFNPNTYTSIPWHTIPEIQYRVKKISGKNKITITDKDNYGTKGIN